MKTRRDILRVALMLLALALQPLLSGCDWDDDDRDHDPPEGKGSIVIENRTSSDIAVFVDGVRLRDVDARDDRTFDVDPGLRRVILDERGGDRTYRDDIDVIEGRLTVLDVTGDPFDETRFDVAVFFD